MAGWFRAEGDDGAAEFVADGYGEGFFCYWVGCDGRETEAGMLVACWRVWRRMVAVLGAGEVFVQVW